jgi:N-methylhydantoinase A/acetophenone carboxylase
MLAETLGIRKVYTFPVGSVFSAFGSSLLEVVHIYEYCLAGQAHLTNGRLALGGWFRELLDHARKDIVGEALGTDYLRFRIQIEVADDRGITTVFETDVTQNQESLDSPGASETNGAVIMARLKAIITAATPLLEVLPSMIKTETRPALMGERSVFWSDAAENTPIYRGESLSAGTSLQGPLIIEHAYTTIAVPRGWLYRIDAVGHGIMERGPG